MYTLQIIYSGGSSKIYSNIERIEYKTFTDEIVLSGDEISTHTFIMGHDLHLFSANQHHLVPRQGIIRITALKEQP